MVPLPRNKKQTYRFNSRPQMWPWGLTLTMALTLNFQGQIWNLLYLIQKASDCHETKSKHMDGTHGLQCDHGVWPWPWPRPWIFKVKHGICYISIKSDPKIRCKDVQVTGVTSDVGVPSTHLVSKLILVIDGWSISCEIVLKKVPLDLVDELILVNAMPWCRQATSHYLNQCWHSSISLGTMGW